MKQVNQILLILLWVEKANLELRLNQVNESSVLPDYAVRILTTLGPIRKMAVLFSEHFFAVTKIIQRMNVPVIVNAEETPVLQGLDKREPCEVVFLMQQPLSMFECLNNILWTSETHFILVLMGINASDEIMQQIFQFFWTANVINVFIFVATSWNISVYTYQPFVFPKCDSVELFLLNSKSNTFTLKNRANDLHGCLLNVSVVDLPPMAIFPNAESRSGTFELQGTEANILHEVAKKLNFVPRFAVAKDGEAWGWIYPSPHGVVGEVYLKRSHFGFGLLASTLERYECLDMTVPVSPLRECITWAVPVGAAKSRSVWVDIFLNEFSPAIWCCIGISFPVVCLTFWVISKTFRLFDFIQVIMYLYSAFIFVPVKTPNCTVLRLLFLSWLWYAFIIMISYQSLMGSKLTVPFHQRDIETIQDLLESNLHFTGFYNTFRLISYGAEGDLKEVVKRLEATTYGLKEAIIRIVFDRNIAYLRETTSFKYFTMSNPQAKGKVHFMRECAYQYYPIMVLQKRSPLSKITNDVIARLFESGILMKWRRNFIHISAGPSPPNIKLTLNHMLAPFLAFLLGIGLSIFAFIVELLLHKFYKKKL